MSDPTSLRQKTDTCVRCGLCLPHCPTFQLTRLESHSPRGRIVLTQGLDTGAIPPTPAAQKALETCLSCYRCETVCPAEVNYSDIIETARARWAPTSLGLLRFFCNRHFTVLCQGLGWLFQPFFPFIQTLIPLRLLSRAPRCSRPQAFLPYYPAHNIVQGEVCLFLGCMTRMAYTPLLKKSIRLLQKAGYGVYVPEAQGCCGALFAHSGHTKEASLCQKTLHATGAPFAHLPLLTLATGCERDLHAIFPKTQSLTDFFLTHIPLSTPRAPLPKFAWHIPCTQKKTDIFEDFLKKHHISYHILPKTCCGAAGVQMLTQPIQADALGNTLLQAIPTTISCILSSNIGCQTHLQALFRARHPANQVLHPLEFLFKTGFFESK